MGEPNGNWERQDREDLANSLREVVKRETADEKTLFDALLKRFVENYGSKRDFSVKEAASMIGKLTFNDHSSIVHKIIHDLRERIEKASENLIPSPQATIRNKNYELLVFANPPRLQKKYHERCIGLLLADAADWFVGDLIKGINAACAGRYDLIVDVSNYSQRIEEKKIIQLTQKVHGLLLVPVGDHALDGAIEALGASHTVLIDRYLTNLPKIPCVHPDDKLAGRFAAQYLIESLKCERIIIVDQGSRAGGKFVISPLTDRADGCDDASGDVEVIRLPPAGTDERGGWKALQEFETPDQRILDSDGIFALTDRVAVGCRHYLATKHPEFDPRQLISTEGQQFGDFMRPPLVSIKFDNFEMGKRAAEILISEIEGKPAPNAPVPPRYHIGCTLLVPGEDPIERNSFLLEDATRQDKQTA